MQLLKYIQNSIKSNFMNINENPELKEAIIDLIHTLTVKVYEEPSLINLLFADSNRLQAEHSTDNSNPKK